MQLAKHQKNIRNLILDNFNRILNSDLGYSIGRVLIGFYFFFFGLMKIPSFTETHAFMITKSVPFVDITILLTIFIQVVFGALIIINKNVRFSALMLFVLTLLINTYIHNFWNLLPSENFDHELQNFVKNLGIAAGLLILTKYNK